MGALVTAVSAVFSFPRFGKILRLKNWIAVGLVLIVSADAVKLSKQYVKEMPRSYIQSNALTDFLKENLGDQRVALVSQQGIYNVWISSLLPYHKIATFNFAQMGRIPTDYEKLLAAGSKSPLRMWRFAGVKYLLAPSTIEKQLPAGQIKRVFAYDLAAAPNNGFPVVARPSGAHAVFEFIHPIPRYSLVKQPEQESDEQMLARLADARQPLPGTNRAAGSVERLHYRPGRVELQVDASESCLLRAAERWDVNWKASVDGIPVEVQTIDFIGQGVDVSPGRHQIMLTYAPSRTFFYMQCGGGLALLVALIIRRPVRHEED